MIEGYVPLRVLHAMKALLEFCYIVHHDVIMEETLVQLDNALACFLEYWSVFQEEGIRLKGFTLPQQHSMKHYLDMIHLFGAPNGLCSSITEAKHIKVIKEPWRRSNCNYSLKQILLINQRLDKLAAVQINFTKWRMLEESKLHLSLGKLGLSSFIIECTLVTDKLYRAHAGEVQ